MNYTQKSNNCFSKQWCISICAMCGPLRNAWRDVESNNVEAVKRWNGQHTVHHGRASGASAHICQ